MFTLSVKSVSSAVMATLVLLVPFLTCAQDTVSVGDQVPFQKDTYTYKIVGDQNIMADVYRLPDKKIRPVILHIHGGALIFGDRGVGTDVVLKYLGAGFTVVSIDYRVAPEIKLPAIIEDVEDAYAWVREHGPELFHIDPDRIAVLGQSAGGYLALMAGIRCEPRPKALVTFYGYGDLTGSWYSEPSAFHNQRPPISRDQALAFIRDPNRRDGLKFYLYCRQQGLWPQEVGGYDPKLEREWFREYEPLHNITKMFPPTLLLHGETDKEVPFEQSLMMAAALKQNNIEHELISNPKWGHLFDAPWNSKNAPKLQEAYIKILEFLIKHVR
jgi:acetyl esterase/lipase